MKNLPLLIGTVLLTVGLVVAVAFFFSGGRGGASQPSQAVDQATLLAGATNIKGPAAASITIVEFSDFQCPACKAAEPAVVAAIASDPQQVKLVYRHFPLDSIHPFARLAAQASEAAANQDQFWSFHQLLFAKQSEWTELGNRDTVETTLIDYAEQLGMDREQFGTDLASDEVVAKVAADSALATKLGLNSTPTFFVNGISTPASQLSEVVQSQLAQTTN